MSSNFVKVALISLLLVLSGTNAYAHPGRTDSSGGHYVRTAGYGYPVGSYHYHNGGNTTSTDSNYDYDKGYNAGYKKGYSMGYKEDYSSFTYYYSSNSYKNGYDEGFDKGFDAGLTDFKAFKAKQAKEDYDKGYSLGLLTKTPSKSVPFYSKDEVRQGNYSRGYNGGINELLNNDYKKGIQDGNTMYTEVCPKYSDDPKRQSKYESGFAKGQIDGYASAYISQNFDFNFEAYHDGYESAFDQETIIVPEKYVNHFEKYLNSVATNISLSKSEISSLIKEHSIDENQLKEEFARGFNSNDEVKLIKQEAFKDGVFFSKSEKLEKGQYFYDKYFDYGRTSGVLELEH